MKKILHFIFFSIIALVLLTSAKPKVELVNYIDPTIGNSVPFLVPTYPTMHLPNKMLRMYPVKQDYISDQVLAFPLQVTSHRNPGIFQMKLSITEVSTSTWNKKMNIDHDLERVHPWFYSSYLIDDNIRVSFTPGEKGAIYKIQFPDVDTKNILIQGSSEMKCATDGNSFSFEESLKYDVKGPNPTSRKMKAFLYGILTDKNDIQLSDIKIVGENGKFYYRFGKTAPTTFFLKYAISYISVEQAKINFYKELSTRNFDKLVNDGKKIWEKTLGQIQLTGGAEAQKRTFYTSLYRTYERMVDINEGGKYFSAYDGKVHESTRPFFVDDWIWDTYRAQHPLRTILQPQAENDMLNSYVEMFEQSGTMPTFPQLLGNHLCMNAYHSSAIFIDGYRKGLRNYNVEKAFEGIKKNLTEETFIPWRQGLPKQLIDDFFHEKGFFPALRIGQPETEPMVDDFEKRQAVAVTLGISYDAWTLAQLAKELGKSKDYQHFTKMGNNYKNLWHPEKRLFMPKDEQGEWIMINPKSDGGPGYRDYYDENNGWTYAWDVQHDISGLIALLGGNKAAEERLDQMFREPLDMKKSLFYVNGANSTGLVGQFSMGNEPSFHIPYLYNYFGAPWKTQKMTRFLLDVWFKDNIWGIPGDEDGGGMTAFVVFTSIGLYPVTPGLPIYTITSPVFEKISIQLENGKKFTVLANGASKSVKYIQKAFINGKEINTPFITHKQIMEGGTLELILSELPNKEWGRNAKTQE